MSPTATKPKSASRELEDLETKRRETYAAVQEAKNARNEFDEETEQMRTDYTLASHRGTAQPDVEQEIKTRMGGENPHTADFDACVAEFHEADEAVQRFRITRMSDLLAELDPAHTALADRYNVALQELVDAGAEYADQVERINALVSECPIIDGQSTSFDNRPAEWQVMAEGALEHDLLKPGITDYAKWQLEQAR